MSENSIIWPCNETRLKQKSNNVDDSYSPVTCLLTYGCSTKCLCFTIWMLRLAFLYGLIEAEVYMKPSDTVEIPRGFVLDISFIEHHVTIMSKFK